MLVNNWTIFLTGRKITLEKWPNSTLSGHGHNIFRKAKCTELNTLNAGRVLLSAFPSFYSLIYYSRNWNTHIVTLKLKKTSAIYLVARQAFYEKEEFFKLLTC